jgi:hypothetical protein
MKTQREPIGRQSKLFYRVAHMLILLAISTTSSVTMAQTHQKAARHGHAIFNPTAGTNLTFGNIRIGQTKQQTFSFANTGDDTLFVQSLELSNDTDFTIQFARLTIAPKQSGTVILQFAPRAGQTYDATLSFAVANGVVPPVVALHGRGSTMEEAEISGSTIIPTSGGANRMKRAH